MELVTVTVLLHEFEQHRQLFTHVEYKEVTIKDDFFKDDVMHAALKTKSIKAYKELKEYEFNQRNK